MAKKDFLSDLFALPNESEAPANYVEKKSNPIPPAPVKTDAVATVQPAPVKASGNEYGDALDMWSHYNKKYFGERPKTEETDIATNKQRFPQWEPMDTMEVTGKFSSVDTGKNQDKQPTDPKKEDKTEIPWGEIISGALPYALEGLFGGGKYMGAAAEGSMKGAQAAKDTTKMIKDAQAKKEKEDADRRLKEQAEADKKAYQDELLRLKEKELDKPKYFYKEAEVDGKPQMVGFEQSGQEPLKTGVGVTQKPVKDVEGSRDARFNRGLDARQQEAYSKRLQESAPAISATKAYIDTARNLESFSPRYAKTPDANLPANLQAERTTVRKLVHTYIVEVAGKAQTESEIRNASTALGINLTPKTIQEMLTDPSSWVDRTISGYSQGNIRNSLDNLAQQIINTQKIAAAGYDPKNVETVHKRSGFAVPNMQPYSAPQASSINDRINRLKAGR